MPVIMDCWQKNDNKKNPYQKVRVLTSNREIAASLRSSQ